MIFNDDHGMTRLVSAREAAEILSVNVQTVRRWVRDGTLSAVRLPGGQIRIPLEEIERLISPAA